MVIRTLSVLQTGNLASGSDDETVRIWNPNNGSLLFTLTGHDGFVSTLVTLPNGNIASAGRYDNTVRIWNPNTGSLLYTLTGHAGSVSSLVTLPNGNLASAGRHDNTVRIWTN